MQYEIIRGYRSDHVCVHGNASHKRGDIICVDGRRFCVKVLGERTKHIAGDGTDEVHYLQDLYGDWV